MARQAGFLYGVMGPSETRFVTAIGHTFTVELEAFAKLVEAKAAEREREACAKVCDELSKKHSWEGCYANECAEEIRARGNT